MEPIISLLQLNSTELYETLIESFPAFLQSVCLNICIFLLVYLVVGISAYWWYVCGHRTEPSKMWPLRSLIVIAHPDDECMFFGPTIYGLLKSGSEVYILCLSDGDHEGLGGVRGRELWAACAALGVAASRVCLVRDSRLRDDPQAAWPPPLLADIILRHIERHEIGAVVTFDGDGVSGHANHCAVHRALLHARRTPAWPAKCELFALESVGVVRKYSGHLDLLLSALTSQHWWVLSWAESGRVSRAMRRHASQLAWYRRAYVASSRYLALNTLARVSADDARLHFALDLTDGDGDGDDELAPRR